MDRMDNTKDKKGFTILVVVSFFSVSFFLLLGQYVSFNYTDAIFEENNYLIRENLRLALEKKGGTPSFIETRIEKGDTILLVTYADKTQPQYVRPSTVLTGKDLQDLKLNGRLAWNAGEARKYSYFTIAVILCLGAALCWLIIWQFRRLNKLVIARDIAEKKAQEALIVKENFLSNMSHEIRTPLNSIIGFTKLIGRRNLSPDVAEFTTAIQHAGDNLLRIVNDVLDLSKMEAGMLAIVPKPFRVRELMRSVETLFRQRVQEKGLRLSVTVDGQVPDLLSGDDTRLTQILVNLIGNAIKFSPGGEIRVLVSVESQTSSEAMLNFKVRDEGIGIEPEKLSQIFERFTQADTSTARKYGGTGLGLAIVRDLVALQNGTIQAQSQPGAGTEIGFRIGYTIAKEEPEPIADTAVLQVASGLEVLVVDDNIMNQSLMQHLLEDWKISCTLASDGSQAIEWLRKQHFDLILMDIQMPVMDGYAAAQYIRENLQLSTPIIAMTAYALEGEKEKCLHAGMDGYIAKPVNEHELLNLIAGFTKSAVSVRKTTLYDVIAPDFHYIDLAYIKEVSNGSTAYEKTVTQQFIDLVPVALESLKAAAQRQDSATVRQIAHQMQTTLSIMGIVPKYGYLLDALERADVQHPEYPAIDELTAICQQAVAEARELYASLHHN